MLTETQGRAGAGAGNGSERLGVWWVSGALGSVKLPGGPQLASGAPSPRQSDLAPEAPEGPGSGLCLFQIIAIRWSLGPTGAGSGSGKRRLEMGQSQLGEHLGQPGDRGNLGAAWESRVISPGNTGPGGKVGIAEKTQSCQLTCALFRKAQRSDCWAWVLYALQFVAPGGHEQA